MKLSTACPLLFSPPFVHPWRRALHADSQQRLTSWLAELLPGVDADFIEWVGADPRHPIHAVVASFSSDCRPPITLYMKGEDIERHHLAQALDSSRRSDHLVSRSAGNRFTPQPSA